MGLFGHGQSQSETKCKECGTDLHDPERLRKHQKKAHTKPNEKCRVCGTVFNSSVELRKHKKKCK
jgi:uncharacterized Zn finger protein